MCFFKILDISSNEENVEPKHEQKEKVNKSVKKSKPRKEEQSIEESTTIVFLNRLKGLLSTIFCMLIPKSE